MKKCKNCWEQRWHNNPLIALCKTCVYKKSESNPKQTRIKQVSSKNKNTPAKFSVKTKREIVERDRVCIVCWEQWTDVHHVYFSQECEYWQDRNNIDKWVLLCRLCHWKCHACPSGEWVRQEVINYLKEIWNK